MAAPWITDTRPPVRTREQGEVVLRLDDLAHQDADARRQHLSDLLGTCPSGLVVEVAGDGPLSSATVAIVLETTRLCCARRVPVTVSPRSRAALQVLRRVGIGSLADLERGDHLPLPPSDAPALGRGSR